jgi:hypothetical protein
MVGCRFSSKTRDKDFLPGQCILRLLRNKSSKVQILYCHPSWQWRLVSQTVDVFLPQNVGKTQIYYIFGGA